MLKIHLDIDENCLVYLNICIQLCWCLDVEDTLPNNLVFDPEIHTELIIKNDCEDLKTGNLESLQLF